MQGIRPVVAGWSLASRRSVDAARRAYMEFRAAPLLPPHPERLVARPAWSSASHEPSGRHASIPPLVVGPAHRLYLRKAEGRRRPDGRCQLRPQLNTDDLETRLRFVDIDELLEEEGYHDEEARGSRRCWPSRSGLSRKSAPKLGHAAAHAIMYHLYDGIRRYYDQWRGSRNQYHGGGQEALRPRTVPYEPLIAMDAPRAEGDLEPFGKRRVEVAIDVEKALPGRGDEARATHAPHRGIQSSSEERVFCGRRPRRPGPGGDDLEGGVAQVELRVERISCGRARRGDDCSSSFTRLNMPAVATALLADLAERVGDVRGVGR